MMVGITISMGIRTRFVGCFIILVLPTVIVLSIITRFSMQLLRSEIRGTFVKSRMPMVGHLSPRFVGGV